MLRPLVNNSTPLLVANTEVWGPKDVYYWKKIYTVQLFPLHMEEATATCIPMNKKFESLKETSTMK